MVCGLQLFLLIAASLAVCTCTDIQLMGITRCNVTEWGTWSECSTNCGTGYRLRTRKIIPTTTCLNFAVYPLTEFQLCSQFDGCTTNINDACLLNFDRGSCNSDYFVWTFNRDRGMCEHAFYSGCGGNANRFSSKEECDRQCQLNTCYLAFSAGGCSSNISVWTYNHYKDRCEIAVYGGCLGNANRFTTMNECEWRCLNKETCKLKFDAGPCNLQIPVWTFNSDKHICEKAVFGGCRGNSNKFVIEEDCRSRCQKEDTCVVQFDAGPCTTYKQVWTYNPDKKLCEEAVYGGCQGNSNKFITKDECDKRCQNKDSCRYDSDNCSVSANGEIWTYDSLIRQCVQTFNSCSSSPNNFRSEKDCKKICQPLSAEEICFLPFDAGSCNALVYVWAYNSTTNKCEEKKYGGCKGNANRFSSARECQRTCLGAA